MPHLELCVRAFLVRVNYELLGGAEIGERLTGASHRVGHRQQQRCGALALPIGGPNRTDQN